MTTANEPAWLTKLRRLATQAGSRRTTYSEDAEVSEAWWNAITGQSELGVPGHIAIDGGRNARHMIDIYERLVGTQQTAPAAEAANNGCTTAEPLWVSELRGIRDGMRLNPSSFRTTGETDVRINKAWLFALTGVEFPVSLGMPLDRPGVAAKMVEAYENFVRRTQPAAQPVATVAAAPAGLEPMWVRELRAIAESNGRRNTSIDTDVRITREWVAALRGQPVNGRQAGMPLDAPGIAEAMLAAYNAVKAAPVAQPAPAPDAPSAPLVWPTEAPYPEGAAALEFAAKVVTSDPHWHDRSRNGHRSERLALVNRLIAIGNAPQSWWVDARNEVQRNERLFSQRDADLRRLTELETEIERLRDRIQG